jgi:hypothetical protein
LAVHQEPNCEEQRNISSHARAFSDVRVPHAAGSARVGAPQDPFALWARHHQVRGCVMFETGKVRAQRQQQIAQQSGISASVCLLRSVTTAMLRRRRRPVQLADQCLCRTGICLPLVCKAFRSTLLDMQDVNLWGTVAPLSCVPQHVMPASPDRWFLLEEWLEACGPAIRILHITWVRVREQKAATRRSICSRAHCQICMIAHWFNNHMVGC